MVKALAVASWITVATTQETHGRGDHASLLQQSNSKVATITDEMAASKKYGRGFLLQQSNRIKMVATITDEMRAAAPATLDWSTQGATTPVKDQGDCSSAWAYSATEGIESAVYMAAGRTVELSEQQIISCDKADRGCDGGDLPTAFDYVMTNEGIDTRSDYPDTSAGSADQGTCKTQQKKAVKVSEYKYAVPPCESGGCDNQKESDLRAALNEHGPLSVCVNAKGWESYSTTKGIYRPKIKCTGNLADLDHCVQLVGYGTAGRQRYWKVRNSWGSDWGEGGFIRLPMGENACGIANEAMFTKADFVSSDSAF